MIRICKLTIVLLLGTVFIIECPAQSSQITLEDIWSKSHLRAKRVPGFNFMNDGEHYTRRAGDLIVRYNLVSGDAVDTLFVSSWFEDRSIGTLSSYAFSADESLVMIKANSESIYRRSTKANFYVFDRAEKTLQEVYPDGKIMHCTLSPNGTKAAFVFDNNLYCKDLQTGKIRQITKDGKYNHIINGSADWVYEEEFGFTKGFLWSPDSRRIAFYRFDEAHVKEFPMEFFNGGMYPELVTFKYPKVGEENALVSIHIHDLGKNKTIDVDQTSEPNGYIPRIKWSHDPGRLVVFKMNRHQNLLQLWLTDARTGRTDLLMQEENKYFVDITDDLTFLSDGSFIWTSEKDGYNHIYLYSSNGELKRQLTKGPFDVTSYYGLDEAKGKVFYQAAARSPLRREIYSVSLQGGQPAVIAKSEGSVSAQFSSTYDYFVLNKSGINTPPSYVVYTTGGDALRVIEDNAELNTYQRLYGAVPVEFFKFKTSEDVELNGYMIKPPFFDSTRQYPVFMYLYGGPGSQQVVDNWRGNNYWWFQMLAQQGFIVACVDNRGTGARGEEFRKMTYLQLGHYETIDQIEAAKYLGNLRYTDPGRIGIFGWSYGGYMSSLCLLKGNDVFKSAIAVAPVTNWKWYDTIYTERYMRTLRENRDGYENNSPINFADQLKGDYLLVHGIADDNVHWQHTVEMANALIRANKQFDTYFYPNRNHGIYGDNARLHLYTKMTNFLRESLGVQGKSRS